MRTPAKAPEAPKEGDKAAKAPRFLSGVQKAAILLITLGSESSANVFKLLREDEIQRLTCELMRQERVDLDTKRVVFKEFEQLYSTCSLLSQGGSDYARSVLEQAVGAQKAQSMLSEIRSARGAPPSDWLQHVDAAQLARWLQNEQPQTVALVLTQVPAARAAQVLAQLPSQISALVTVKIAKMQSASPEIITQIEESLRSKMSGLEADTHRDVGGVQALVEILNSGDRSLERSVLDSLAADDPSLAEEVKLRLFVFEDILQLDDRAVQVVLREAEQDDLRLALRGSQETVKEKIYKNMSERAASTLREDLEMSGPVRLRDVEAAQQRIALVIRSLEERGEISMARPGEDDLDDEYV